MVCWDLNAAVDRSTLTYGQFRVSNQPQLYQSQARVSQDNPHKHMENMHTQPSQTEPRTFQATVLTTT